MEQRSVLSPGTAGPRGLTAAEIARRLAARPLPGPQAEPCGRERGDEDTSRRLAGDDAAALAPLRPCVAAAVLVPLVERPDGLRVLLTQRTAHLDHHPGQISFPGGRVEPGDADAVAAALRETAEEVGIDPAQVEVLGRLDDYVTSTGFRVTPVVGFVREPMSLRPDPFEVAEIFEVPLAFLLDSANHQRHYREGGEGMRRYFYAMPYGDHYIWGATAGMLVNFWEALGRP